MSLYHSSALQSVYFFVRYFEINEVDFDEMRRQIALTAHWFQSKCHNLSLLRNLQLHKTFNKYGSLQK